MRIKKLYKKYFASWMLATAAIFFLLAGFSYLSASKTTPIAPKQQTKQVLSIKKVPKTTPVVTISHTVQSKLRIPTPTVQINLPQPTNTPAPQPNAVATSTNESEKANQPSTDSQVTLSINGSSVGSITIPNGANQCDVLNQALAQQKITSLLMKYDNSLGTYAVYQINGVGKENAVWWTYKANGQSPSQGCSYIKAANGDIIEWKYIGS